MALGAVRHPPFKARLVRAFFIRGLFQLILLWQGASIRATFLA
jgi:hypothetical protein